MEWPNQPGTLAAGAVSGNSQPGQDAQMDYMAPWESNGPAEYEVPSNSWEDQCLKQATLVLTMPRQQIRRLVHCPLPQVGTQRPGHLETPSLEGIFASAHRDYPDQRAWMSGSPAGYSGALRNGWGSGNF